ncbi:MAG: DNA/RNA nuclease SfsA [Sphingomonadales bacterium]
MKFPDPLIRGRLIRRYKRFLSDIELENGEVVVAHCANPGSMTGLTAPGSEVWLSPARNPDRKLKFSWEMIRVDGGLVGINTAHPNAIVAEAVKKGDVPELAGYSTHKREIRYGNNSRIDLLLEDAEDGGPKCYVEVKNVHLKRTGPAEFPDSVTKRGTKHLHELADMVDQGYRAVMFYLVQRMDCDRFCIAGDIDPEYEKALIEARRRGVEALCYDCTITIEGVALNQSLTLNF